MSKNIEIGKILHREAFAKMFDDIRDKHHPDNEREDEDFVRCFMCHGEVVAGVCLSCDRGSL